MPRPAAARTSAPSPAKDRDPFLGDPVQPGCLGVDAVWQLLGVFCNWAGGLGSGRALGCGEIEFFGH